MQFYIRGRVPPLCLTSSVPANYIRNPQAVVAFGVLLRMLKCQILLLPTCFGHVSLNNTSQKSENFRGGGRGNPVPSEMFTESEGFAHVATFLMDLFLLGHTLKLNSKFSI